MQELMTFLTEACAVCDVVCLNVMRCVLDLIESFLQVWSSHTLCQVSVCRMGQEELSLCSQSSLDVLLSINVLLAAVHHPDVT